MSPRKPRNVTPPAAGDPAPEGSVPPSGAGDTAADFDAFAEALANADDVFGAIPEAETTAETVTEAVTSAVARIPGYIGDVDPDELEPRGRAILVATEVLADFSTALAALRNLPEIPLVTPDDRALAVKLYNRLEVVETTVGLWRSMVARRFREFLIENGADRATLPGDRFVSYTPPEAKWEANGQGMKRDLDLLVADGTITPAQRDEVVRTITEYKVDNTKANALAKHYGAKVAQAINRNRRRVDGPGQGKVSIPKEVQR